jgi:hypothetical protein
MLHAKIALIDKTAKAVIPFSQLTRVAAALNTQANRDLAHHWPLTATVTAMLPSATVPVGVWPIYIVDQLSAGEGGYHWVTATNQPYAEVVHGPGWTVAASHECCEILVDPSGNRLQTARSIVLSGEDQSLGFTNEAYLVEICDPCELHGYTIDGVAVSDFVIPQYYHTGTKDGKYSYTGNIVRPLQILFGGYISWIDQTTNEVWQITWLDESQPPALVNLGSATSSASLKSFVDGKTGTVKRLAASTNHPAVELAALMEEHSK